MRLSTRLLVISMVVVCAVCAVASTATAAPSPAPDCSGGTCSLSYGFNGGTAQTWTPPTGVGSAMFAVEGGQGGAGQAGDNGDVGGQGGTGAVVRATLGPLSSTDQLAITVGAAGTGGEPGGGDGPTGITSTVGGGGGGGGCSEVALDAAPEIVAAGGGGGGGGGAIGSATAGVAGGAGGDASGAVGNGAGGGGGDDRGTSLGGGEGGAGADLSGPGGFGAGGDESGSEGAPGQPGTQGAGPFVAALTIGGDGGPGIAAGGGGGCGWFGGGGGGGGADDVDLFSGGGGGGGAGSSYPNGSGAPVGSGYSVSGGGVGNGSVSISYANPLPPSAPTYDVGYGQILDATGTSGLAVTYADANGLAGLTYVLDVGAAHGSVGLTVNGDFSYVPETGFAGSDAFTVSVSDPAGDSRTVSVPLVVAAGVPAVPSITGASAGTAGSDAVTLDFTAPADDGGAPITGYTVAAVPTGGGAAVNASGRGSPITVTGLVPGLNYSFTVSAINATGSGPASAPVIVRTPPALDPSASIAVPSGGAVYTLGQSVTESFSCAEGLGGLGIQSCVDQDGNAAGAAVDTGSDGTHKLTITATSKDGQIGTARVTYVVEPPMLISTPAPTQTAPAGPAPAGPAPGGSAPATDASTPTAGPPPTGLAPPGPARPAPNGSISGRRLGSLQLTESWKQAQVAYGGGAARGHSFQLFYTLSEGGIRVGAATPKVLASLSPKERKALRGRIVWASTWSDHYRISGLGMGSRRAQVEAKLPRGQLLTIGKNQWYLAAARGVTAVFKLDGGRVTELGIALKQLTGSRGADRALMSNFDD